MDNPKASLKLEVKSGLEFDEDYVLPVLKDLPFF